MKYLILSHTFVSCSLNRFKTATATAIDYMINYTPAPSVKILKETSEEIDSKSLGKWFPKASVVKSGVCYSNDYLAVLAKERKRQQRQQVKSSSSNSASNNKTTNAATTIIPPEPKTSLVLFYQYVSPPWSQNKVSAFCTYITNIAKTHRTNIGGRVRVSTEGVNCTVSAASTSGGDTSSNREEGSGQVDVDPQWEAAQTLRHFAQDLINFDPQFSETDFKYIDGLSADRHFKELKLLPVKELVFYGIREEDCGGGSGGAGGKQQQSGGSIGGGRGVDANGAAAESSSDVPKDGIGGIHLDAKEYHEMLKKKDAVVIDVRNHYEAAIGRFDGQMQVDDSTTKAAGGTDDGDEGRDDGGKKGGAEYIDPKMRKSTDFTSWLAEPETKKKLEGKTVMMFCTGEN